MSPLPDLVYDPFGLTPAELQECSDEAEDDPPDVPWPVSMALAMERRLVTKGNKPDPWMNLFINQFVFLKAHAESLAQALDEALSRAEAAGLDLPGHITDTLDNYLNDYPEE